MTDSVDIPLLQNEIEKELASCIDASTDPRFTDYEAMFTYQMDWESGFQGSRGKRVRPLLVLLSTYSIGGDWRKALPAAASLELMHNFSLIHDDIQDQSLTRRGKPTLWINWGQALAINAGDAMLALSSLALQRLNAEFTPEIVNQAAALTHNACRSLTRGQFLDISFESRFEVSLDDYWQMVGGKTSALLSAALEIGALLGGASPTQCLAMRSCGFILGSAYQVQDDWLGIWGENALLGKSTQSDLLARKKSYPILSGLAKRQSFYTLWSKPGEILKEDIPALVRALTEDGVKEETEAQMEILYRQTLTALNSADCFPEYLPPLQGLLNKLMNRFQ